MANIKRETVEAVLQEIEAKDGVITVQAVVEEARNSSSPIHDCFEWDNDRAAEKYREVQARKLIAYYYEPEKAEYEPARYYNVTVGGRRGYVSENRIKEAPNLYKQVLKDALTGLIAWQERYSYIKELKNIINKKEVKKVESVVS